jgi:uncharacterized membrane protein YbhN (UPF0104 family)
MNRFAGAVQRSVFGEPFTSLRGQPNSRIRRCLSVAFWAVLSIALLALLVLKLGISLDDLAVAVRSTPAWLIATILASTFLIQVITSYRWKIAIDWLSPGASHIRFLDLLKATTWGTVLGQVLPLQVSLSLGRWWSVRDGRGRWVVGTTLYEQMFDLVVLCAGAIGAVLAISLAASPMLTLAVFTVALAGGSLAVRHLFALGHWIALRLGRGGGIGAKIAGKVTGPLAAAKDAPTQVLFLLSAASVGKLLLLVLRPVAVAAVLAPAARSWTVAVGYPLVGLAVANPLMPGGLGVAEWSWTGLLVLAGSAASAAGVAALVLRVLNVAALGIVMIVLAPFGRRR